MSTLGARVNPQDFILSRAKGRACNVEMPTELKILIRLMSMLASPYNLLEAIDTTRVREIWEYDVKHSVVISLKKIDPEHLFTCVHAHESMQY